MEDPALHAPQTTFQAPFVLGEFRINPADGTVAGPAGSLHIEPKLISVLILLARHAGKVVSRQTLLDEVWHGTVVTDDALTRCISELRAALGDDRSSPRFIKTVPKRGYCLLVQPEQTENTFDDINEKGDSRALIDSSGIFQSLRTWRQFRVLLACVAGLVLLAITVQSVFLPRFVSTSPVQKTSVAVLPFSTDINTPADLDRLGSNSSPEKSYSSNYYSEGIESELRNTLMQIEGLDVASQYLSRGFKADEFDPRVAGKNLGVTAILTGSIHRSQKDLRVSVQLISSSTGFQLWADNYTRKSGELFDLQSTIAQQVARVFQLPGPQTSSVARISSDLKALDYYLLGRHYWNLRDLDSLQQAVTYFQLAIQTDDTFALAYSGLADSYVLLASGDALAEDEAVAKAEEAVEKARALQPELAEVQASLGILKLHQGKVDAAEQALARAVALNPHYPMGLMWLGNVDMWRGQYSSAYDLYQKAYRADPALPVLAQNLINAATLTGHYETAEELLADNLPGSGELDAMFLRLAANTALEQAHYDSAREYARRLAEQSEYASEGYLALAKIAWRDNRPAVVENYLDRANEKSPGASSVYYSRLDYLSRTADSVARLQSAIEVWHARNGLPFDQLSVRERFFLGLSKIRSGHYSAAIDDLKGMINEKLGHEYLVARIMAVGYLAAAAGHLSDDALLQQSTILGRALLAEAESGGLNSFPLQIQRAFLLAALGDEAEAEKGFSRLLQNKAIGGDEVMGDLRSRSILDSPVLAPWLAPRSKGAVLQEIAADAARTGPSGDML